MTPGEAVAELAALDPKLERLPWALATVALYSDDPEARRALREASELVASVRALVRALTST